MRPLLNYLLLGLFCLAVPQLTGCGGSTSVAGGGGISGTGAQTIAVGQVTGFGSVIVGGTEYFAKPGSRILLSFSNLSTTQENVLQPGMSVNVKGSFNETLSRLEYETIDYRPELRGPLAAVSLTDATLTILGKQVRVDSNTRFSGGIQGLTDLDTIKGQQPEIEISGHIPDLGAIVATRVALVKTAYVQGEPVQLKGQVANLATDSMTIGGQTVTLTGAIFVNLQRSDLAAGLFVEIKGAYDGTTIAAARIERKLPLSGAVSGTKLELRGLALAPIGTDSTFSAAGPDGQVTVRVTSGTTYRRGGNETDQTIVTADTVVEVKGVLQADNSLTATEINAENPG